MTPTLYAYIAVSFLLLILIALIIRLEIKLRRLLRGKNGASLENTIVDIQNGWATERKFKEEMQKYLVGVEKRLLRGVRAVETIRFNAFQGTGVGGSQSFATAQIDEKGNGIILSSLNARERVAIFAKPIKAWHCEYELTPEENDVLDRAKKSISSI